MQLEGIHHISAITGDALRNLDFYTRVLGLRLVKKTVNQDDPTVYHLFYADEAGSPGADLTFFEYPGAQRGRAGAGMIHTIVHRVGSEEALDFWAARLASMGVAADQSPGSLVFHDPEGLAHELSVSDAPDAPLVAAHPDIPAAVAIQGFHAVRAYSQEPGHSRPLLEDALGFQPLDASGWEARGSSRGGSIHYDPPPAAPGVAGGGTVHHVAWGSAMEDHGAWRERLLAAGMRPTPIIDRFWFRSIYFREPSGVLFELATMGPGFTVDEDPAHLGEALILPPAFEHMRERVEAALTPLPKTR